jgi:hypothetical protein
MLSDSYHYVRPRDEAERAYLESFVRDDFEQCHPGETLEIVRRRAAFTKEDKGLYREWLELAAARAAASAAAGRLLVAAA